MPIRKFIAGAMQQIISAAIIVAAAGFGYAALTGGLDIPNDTAATIVGLGIILIWLLIIIGRAARLAITAKRKKPIEKSNIVALAAAILGAVMVFFIPRGYLGDEHSISKYLDRHHRRGSGGNSMGRRLRQATAPQRVWQIKTGATCLRRGWRPLPWWKI